MPEKETARKKPSGHAGLLHNKTVQFILVISLIAIAGFALQFVATRWGPGMISGDEVGYVSSARNLSKGLGLSVMEDGRLVPMTHWAPLFPFLLYLLNFLGADPMTGARLLNALLFAANIALVGVIIRKCTGGLLAPAFGSTIVMSSFFLLQIHSTALTEPAFMFFSLLGFMGLAAYFESEKLLWLIASAVAVALAILTRYAGISLVLTAFAAIILLGRRSLKIMLRDGALFTAVSLLPVACWFLFRDTGTAGGATDRTLLFHPPPVFREVRTLIRSVAAWIFPYPKMGAGVKWGVAAVVLIALAVFLAALGYVLINAARKSGVRQLLAGHPKMIQLLLVFIVVYCIFFYSYIVLIDADSEFSNRTLAPVFLAVVIIVVYAVNRAITELESGRGERFLKNSTLALAVVLACVYFMGAAVWVTRTYREGLGFEGKAWEESEIISVVKRLPENTRIYTNSPEAIYVQTEKASYRTPVKRNQNSRIKNPDFNSEVSRIKKRLDKGGAAFVWFNESYPAMYAPSLGWFKKALDLLPVTVTADGTIFN